MATACSYVHVCRRWRSLVFGSPRRLNLRLFCSLETPVKDTLDIWPALPLVTEGNTNDTPNTDNIIAALGESNRVCEVKLRLGRGFLEKALAVMQVPFPEMTRIQLSTLPYDETPPAIPDSFLGGSAPRLRYFESNGVSFPGFPKLLFSATKLVSLLLFYIPYSSLISPKRSPHSSRCCPASGYFPLISYTLNLALIEVCLHLNARFSPFSKPSFSEALPNICSNW